MKFRKIEISAFRVYNNPKNALFDFSTKSGDTADFVSLYAPNGFGKTSFYDAVEWGVTGSVNRFFIRNKELDKLENNQSSKNEIPLLRNSKLERDTYVKVFSNSTENPFEYKISKDSLLPDLPLKKDADAHEFHKVILSQEWISAFLTEKNGEQRYNKFMEKPELSGINNYYLNLKHLLSVQTKEEDKLRNEINKLQGKIEDIQEQNLLETINLQINKINENYLDENLKPIEIDTTDKELIDFKSLVSSKIVHYKKEKEIIESRINKLRIASIGNEELPSFKDFSEIKKKLPNLLNEIKVLEQLLKKFEEIETTKNELKNKQQSFSELSKGKEKNETIIFHYNQFEATTNKLTSKTELILKLQNDIPKLNEIIEEIKRDEITHNEQLKSNIQQTEVDEEKKKQIPTIEKELREIEKAILELSENTLARNSQLEPIEKKIENLQNLSSELKSIINQLEDSKYPIGHIDENSELKNLISKLKQNNNQLPTEKEKLRLLNEKIEEQQALNSTIEDFIKQGIAIVNERNSSTCPLCEQPYEDFTTLINKISSNKALSETLKDLLNQKNKIVEIIADFSNKIKNGNQRLKDYFDDKVEIVNKEINDKLIALDSLRKLIKEDENKQNNFKSRRAELISSMDGLSIKDYTKSLDEKLKTQLKSKEKHTTDLETCRKNLHQKNEEVKKLKSNISLVEQEKVELEKNKEYKAVSEYFKMNHPSENIQKETLVESLKETTQKIDDVNVNIKALKEQIEILSIELSKYNKENLTNQKSEHEKKKVKLENEANKYLLYFIDNFEITISELSINEISKMIQNKTNESKRLLEKNGIIIDNYITLEKYSEHISEFLQTERTKIDIEKYKKELLFLESKVRTEIEKERKLAKEYLEEKIKDFFYEALINKLYEKIDPHPDFKEVSFIPNLDLDYPRLDVFVKNGNSETLIPNLYFSTAQINILSLCIFLASALKSNEYDCIFIDDPIQSMDSINILSTIDLLRSIIVNNGKQIILSTHDENFHNLLKKKMPSGLFKSKFMELETFGKVKLED